MKRFLLCAAALLSVACVHESAKARDIYRDAGIPGGVGGLARQLLDVNIGHSLRSGGGYYANPSTSYSYPTYTYPTYSYPTYTYPTYSYPTYSYPTYTYPTYDYSPYGGYYGSPTVSDGFDDDSDW